MLKQPKTSHNDPHDYNPGPTGPTKDGEIIWSDPTAGQPNSPSCDEQTDEE